MKKLILGILMLGVMLFAVSGVVSADGSGMYIDDVTLNGGSSVTVESGDEVETEVTVYGWGVGDENDWESTSYLIEGESWQCVDTKDHLFGGTVSNSFDITIPSLSAGSYDFSVKAFKDSDACIGDYEDFTLENGIIVEEQEPSCEITVEPPIAGEYYSDDVPIEWSLNGDGCTSPTYNLHFNEDTCTPSNPTDWAEIIDSVNDLEYDWTSGFGEGAYCVRVSEDEGEDFGVSGLFYIDNLDPIADANGETCWCDDEFYSPCEEECTECCCEPDYEEGVYTCYEGDSIILDGSDSDDVGDFPSGIDTWEWYVNGYYVGEGETLEYDCLDGDMTLPVELVVTDNVGNSDTDSAEVHILNVAPTCDDEIEGPTDIALGFSATFTGSGSDVDADMPLTFYWDFDDGDYDSGTPVTHTYTVAGEYTIELTVSDGDGGEDTCYHTIDVVDPVVLDNQEVAAYYPLIADFGDDAGDAGPIPYGPLEGTNPSFETGLVGMGMGDCEVIAGPTNLFTYSIADGECRVRWDNDVPPYGPIRENPTNDEQGTHYVLIRAQGEGGSYDYFTFDIMVYSWIIDLHEGWNLISIPYVPEDTSICAEGIGVFNIMESVDSIWSYEYEACEECGHQSSWKYYAGDCGDSLNTMVPGRGYWFDMNSEAQLKGFGTQIAQTGDFPGQIPEVEVPTGGWSLIGKYGILGEDWYHYPGETCWDAGAISIPTALESLGQSWWSNAQVNEVTGDAHLNEVYKLWNNEGYWLWINEDEESENSRTYTPLDNYYKEDLNCGGCYPQLF